MELITRTAAAYIRTSTDDQMEVSPDSQLGKIREWAETHGYDLPDHLVFKEEEGVSGRQAKHREAFNAMIGTAKQKPAPFDTLPALFAGISRGEIPDRWAQRQPFLGEEAVAARIARVIQKAVTA